MLNIIVGNGKKLEYKSLSVTKSIDNICGGFEVVLDSKRQVGTSILGTSACAINIDGIPLLAGFFDNFTGKTTRTDEDIILKGRDKTSFIVDSDLADGNIEINSKDTSIALDKFIKLILKRNDIDFIDVTNNTYPRESLIMNKERISVDIGDNIFTIIQKYCYLNNVVCTSDFNGNISLERAGRFKSNTVLSLLSNINNNNNIKNSELNLDFTKRYGKYIALSQGSEDFDFFEGSEKGVDVRGVATDPEISPHKKKIFLVNKKVSSQYCTDLAIWEMNIAKKKSFNYTCTISEFKDNDGYPWRPNTLVGVEDSKYGIKSQMLITSVKFNSSRESGFTTDLELTYPEAFSLTFKPGKKDSKGNSLSVFLVAYDKVFYDDKDIPVREYTQQQWENVVGKSNKEYLQSQKNKGKI